MRKNVIKEENRDKALDFYGQIHDLVSEIMENPAIRIEGMNELDQRRLCDLLERAGNLWVEDPQKEAWKPTC